MTFHFSSDGKDTNAGGGHIDLPQERIEKAVHTNAGHPGGIDNAAGMQPGKEVPAPEDRTLHTQPQTPHPPSGNTESHSSDG